MKILYFNQHQLQYPTIQKFLKEHKFSAFEKLEGLAKFEADKGSFYNRKGVDALPFKNHLVNDAMFSMPDYDATFSLSWSAVTDQRCRELRLHKFHQPWVVQWSGGIDSTVVVASILKNLPRSDFENISIACNALSIWENPNFYYNFVEPNFKVVDSYDTVSSCQANNHYIVNGEPGDQLFSCGRIIYSAARYSSWFDELSPERLYDFVCSRADQKFADWYVDCIIKNGKSVGVTLNNLHDYVWWIQFNHNWIGVKMRALSRTQRHYVTNAQKYFDNFIHWFDSHDYQKWSMVNNLKGEKYGDHLADFKAAAKKYIYDVDKNKYYKEYKTKMAGDGLSGGAKLPWCCVLDNYDLLNIEDHLDQILELLPDHLT